MLDQVQRTIEQRRLLRPGQRILVAVSGGADSVALLHALHDLKDRWQLTLAVAHLHHGIRGRAADRDAAFVRTLARRLGLRCFHGRRAVPALAERTGVSLEMAARQARYAFFARAARTFHAHAVATAHTADDQAETVLLRLTRGAGPQGLAGIAYEADIHGLRVIRPLLDTTRGAVLDFLRERRIRWREDETNQRRVFLRNRVRSEILPMLEKRLNPAVRTVLCRTAELMREENEWMETLAAELFAQCRVPAAALRNGSAGHSAGELRVSGLRGLPIAARRRIVRRWLAEAGAEGALIGFDAVESVIAMLRSATGTETAMLPGGWVVRRRYDRLSVWPKAARPVRPYRVALRVPGRTIAERPGLRVTTRMQRGIVRPPRTRPGDLPAEVSLSVPAACRSSLVLRSWRPGDRIRPLGLSGTRKLQDILVDAKVPADERPGIPVLECRGEIVWVPGYRIAQGWEVKNPDVPALRVRVEAL